GDVLAERCRLVPAGGCFPRRQDTGADQFRLTLQLGEDLPGRGLVAAAGGDDLNNAGAVAVLGEPLARLDDDAVAAVLARGQRGGARPALHLPAGEALALAGEGFRPGGEGLRHLLLEHGPHGSPALSPRSQFQAE